MVSRACVWFSTCTLKLTPSTLSTRWEHIHTHTHRGWHTHIKSRNRLKKKQTTNIQLVFYTVQWSLSCMHTLTCNGLQHITSNIWIHLEKVETDDFRNISATLNVGRLRPPIFISISFFLFSSLSNYSHCWVCGWYRHLTYRQVEVQEPVDGQHPEPCL